MSETVEALLRELLGALDMMACFSGEKMTVQTSSMLIQYCERIEEVLRNEG